MGLDKEANQVNKNIEALTNEIENRSAVGRRIVGFEPINGAADPTGSAGNQFGAALDAFNLHLADALAGKEPLDPTLKSTFDERERHLRERLRRQMGPDYETSTAGADALANFDRERSEAYANYNRQSIEGYSRLAESRAGEISRLTSERLRNLAFPATFRASLAQTLEGVARERTAVAQGPAGERAARGRGLAALTAQRQADAAARQEALAGILAGVSSAAPTAAGAAGGLEGTLTGTAGSSDPYTPYGGEFDTAGYLGGGGNLSPSAGTLFGS
jgi:hypothetical protein